MSNKLITFLGGVKRLGALLLKYDVYVNQESYFPDKKRKSSVSIFMDYVRDICKGELINSYYFLYGFDHKTRNEIDEYFSYREFMKYRDANNQTKPYNYICLLRDKQLFSLYGKQMGMPVLCTVGEINEANLLKINGGGYCNTPVSSLLNEHPHLFIKMKDGECGVGVTTIDYKDNKYYLNEEESTKEAIDGYFAQHPGQYIIQDRLIQNEEMSRMYPNAINTLRIVTIRNKHTGDIEVLGSLMRIGTGDMIVDNWAAGGVAVGINPDGTLHSHGFFKPGHGLRCVEHPDTKVKFSEFKVPCYEQAIDLCKQFHAAIPEVHTVGWDVAITVDGPAFIEGNDNWELGFIQLVEGGIKKRFLETL